MRQQVTAEQHTPSRSKRHNRLARLLANALDAAAGPGWNADNHCDVRLQDAPADDRCPDVTVYRADTMDLLPTNPEHVLLVVELVPRGSDPLENDHYARAGIPFYWRVEQAATGAPLVYTYVLDPAAGRYRDSELFTGVVKLAVPFALEVDLGQI